MSGNKVQGEGDRESAQNFNEKSREFVSSEGGQELAEDRDHKGEYSKAELSKAEETASERAKETDPESGH